MAATVTIIGGTPKDVIENKVYKESGAKAKDTNGKNVSNKIVITGAVDTSTIGSYTVTYTLPAADAGEGSDVVSTRTVQVIAAVGTKDTNFEIGNESKRYQDTSGTKYDQVIDSGLAPDANMSALFSETAFDPYEVQHAK